jgi:hypothetical protein
MELLCIASMARVCHTGFFQHEKLVEVEFLCIASIARVFAIFFHYAQIIGLEFLLRIALFCR